MPSGLPGLANDAVAANRFSIEVDGTEIAQFSELTGLVSEIEVIEFKENTAGGHWMIKKLPGNRKPPTITLKRGKNVSMELFAWHEAIMHGQVAGARRHGSVVLRDFENNEVSRYNFINGWPSKISLTSLKAAANEIAMEEVTIVCEELHRVK